MTSSYSGAPAMRPLSAWAVICLAAALSACTTPQTSVVEASSRPAERALLDGLRAYDEARYADAERLLNYSLGQGLGSPADQAAARKTLAFIYCTSNRVSACEQSFRAARAADPRFALSKAEAGHPLWGPVYQNSRR
ncbi:TssQ family T6SS-associated lipoprotein [Ideonella paludis]|uniref:TssQ family T6SS-associated lipoprotein n=2 Tax=Ideonella paludis TaxID=1233411 RepID=A0ABS5E3M9_9BURK|nr:TssQ family T6SS-associated lipoprotein [Ideonella paludis]